MNRDESNAPAPGGGLAAFAVGLAGTWILAGATFKLFWGSPADLPAVVRDTSRAMGLELGMAYNLALTIELAVAALAYLRPRLGWPLVALTYLVFEAVLVAQMSAGEASCGCFGSSVPIPPWGMMAIDGVLLVFMLATRPWSRLGKPLAPALVPFVAVALAVALPWFLDRQVQVVDPGDEGGGPVTVAGAGGGDWMELPLAEWVGQEVWNTPLGQPPLSATFDVAAMPLDGLWVFWRATCDHCAEHLSHLAETEQGERLIGLVQLREAHDTEANRVVFSMPEGNFVVKGELPASIEYVITTPAEMTLEGGVIVSAEEGVGDH